MNENKEVVNPTVIYIESTKDDVVVDVALQYNDSYSENLLSFVNNINTIDGGTHLLVSRAALTRTLNDYGRKSGLIKENESNLSGEDVREGLTAVVSVKVLEPQFEGQTKLNLAIAKLKVLQMLSYLKVLEHSSKNILKMRRKSSKSNNGKPCS